MMCRVMLGLRSGFAVMLVSAATLYAGAQVWPRATADEARVDRLVEQMTLEEKFALIRGAVEPAATYQGQAGYLAGVPRLHVPPMRFADGPPGVLTRLPSHAEPSTMSLASTFSVRDAESIGHVIGHDARALGIDVALQPFINMDRDITFGRGFNTLGEDPYLTGQLGAAEIRGIQAEGVMSMAKHLIGYDSNRYNTFIGEQAMHEVYLAPFADAVAAGVAAVMCSYNKVNGFWACGNSEVQKHLLKGELGFKGFVASDWGGVHSADYINQGLDLEMPGVTRPERPNSAGRPNFFVLHKEEVSPASPRRFDDPAGGRESTIPEEHGATKGVEPVPWSGDGTSLYAALMDKTVSEATVTAAARRVLWEMERFGYLDGAQKDHAAHISPANVNADVLEKVAEDGAVLLRNEGRALPLMPQDLASLALIGPTAGQVDAIGMFGERSGGLPERQVGPLAALRQLAPRAKITFAVNDDMTGTPIPRGQLSHEGKPGLTRKMKDGVESSDGELDFTLSNGKALPADSAASWSGDLTIIDEGEYWIYLQVLGGRGRLSIDGQMVGRTSATAGGVHGDTQQAAQDNGIPTTDGLDNVRRAVHLTGGKHAVRVDLTPDGSSTPAQVRLNWLTPEARVANHHAAIEAAKSAKTAVVFVWTRRNPVFGLPGDQDRLIEEIAAVNSNTIVVLNTSQPIALPWLPKVKAVLQMWWPGDEGGWATAKLLLGMANPSGRLPMTWARELTAYAPNDASHPERSATGPGDKTEYSEGVLVGYRWFDANATQPVFAFGHGLSYTQFAYSDFSARYLADGSAEVKFTIRNTGSTAGAEVPQVYLDAPRGMVAGVQFAPRTLVAFDRIVLKPGETRVVMLRLRERGFQYWSPEAKGWQTPPGPRTIHIGASSRDFRLQAVLPSRP